MVLFFPLQANLYVALMIMCGFVLFDTQLIIEKAESGDKDYIWWVLGTRLGVTQGAGWPTLSIYPSPSPSLPPSLSPSGTALISSLTLSISSGSS